MSETFERESGTDDRRTALVVFFVFVVATLSRGIGEFRYDALFSWLAAEDLVGSGPATPDDFWPLRGVLTAVVYTPAAALSALFGGRLDGFAVLLQNALILGWLAAFLVPTLIRRWHPVLRRTRLIAAGLTWLVVAGFAPFPLVDIYAAVATFGMIAVMKRGRHAQLVFAGVLGGAAVNLRPAYLLTVMIVILISVLWVRWEILLVLVGALLALIPQLVFNIARFGVWSLWPPESGSLMGLQAGLATYIVRYDTLFGAAQPQQFYCSPPMARRLDAPLASSVGDLASELLSNLPTSAVFSFQKIGAALRWPLSTPYTVPAAGLDGLFAILVTATTVLGAIALARRLAIGRHTFALDTSYTPMAVAAVVVGTMVTLVSSATETRFALPMVLGGVLGIATITDVSPRHMWATDRRWVVVAVAATASLVLLGYAGLSSPMPVGIFDPATCAML